LNKTINHLSAGTSWRSDVPKAKPQVDEIEKW